VGDTFGKYQLVRKIARGGMGTVFEARQGDLARSVALKLLSPDLADDPDFRARFEREAGTLARLDSPHVIQVYDAGESQGVLYIATQLVSGRDLSGVLRESGPLPPAVALKIASQVASALSDAHRAGVLHRDVKPSNVLVRESSNGPFAYLCDFGIARWADATHTRTGGLIGTLGYLAPECHDGAPASEASDIYSLGCLLWAALTGRAPYERTSELQVALAHLQDPIPAYAGDSPAREALNQILRTAMAKVPADRYRSAAAMLEDLLHAEEIARGLRREASWSTARGGERPQVDATQVRAVRAVTTAPSAQSGSRNRRRIRLAVGATVAALALLGVGGTAMALLGDTSASPKAKAHALETPEASPSAKPTSPTSRSARAKQGRAGTPTPSSTAAPPGESETVQVAPVNTVTCWDGAGAPNRDSCSMPSGRDGMGTVFPSLSDQCSGGSGKSVSGKAEVYECDFGNYTVRYSRWVKGSDRYGYLNSANPGYTSAVWWIDGTFAGRTWTSVEADPSEAQPYQWSAAYRYFPYTVSVEGRDAAARSAGIAHVVATPPEQVGLR